MKLTSILLLVSILQVSAGTTAQTISYSAKLASLQDIFAVMKQQTGYTFFYDNKDLKDTKAVSVNFKQVPLRDALNTIMAGQPLHFSIVKTTVFIERTSERVGIYLEQPILFPITGIVKDIYGNLLSGATVQIKGKPTSAVTNYEGQFVISADIGDKLLISFVGFKVKELKIKDNSASYIVVLEHANTAMDTATITYNAGYYSVKEQERTGSIARITSKDIEKQPVTSVLAAMQGRMAGVNITQANGVPGSAFKVEIRGQNSIVDRSVLATGKNDPLYVVDGIPYSSQRMDILQLSISILGLSGMSPLNNINPDDVASIEVLKDADATAIYGSRGANGVVLITTKKGKSGKTSFSFSASSGASKVPHFIKLLNTSQYLEVTHEGIKNDGFEPYNTHPYIDYMYDVNGAWSADRNTDWQKELIGGTARSNHFQGSVTGGNKYTQFMINSSFHKETTVFPGDFNFIRGTVHFNVNHNSEDGKFRAVLTGNYGVDKNNQSVHDLTYDAFMLPPNAPALYNEDHQLNWQNSTFENPLSALEQKYKAKTNTLVGSSTFSYEVLPGLEIKTLLGFTDIRYNESGAYPHTALNPASGATSSSSSRFSLNISRQQTWNIEPQLSYKKKLGRGVLGALVGTTFQENVFSKLVTQGFGFVSNNLMTNIAAAINKYITDNQEITYRYNAIFGRLNYVLSEKYFINLTARKDGSSRFGPSKQFGVFGAVGAAWIFSREGFFKKRLPVISFGKLRASYGTTGSDKIGDFEFVDTYTAVKGFNNYQGVVGIAPSRLYNPDFSWEINKKLDLELSLGFWDDRILINTSYYRNRSSNQLLGLQLPATTGFDNVRGNIKATVQNSGWEWEVNTRNIMSGKFKWTSSLNLSIAQNKLIAFPGLAGSPYASFYVVGKPLNISKAFHFTGVDINTGVYQFEDYNKDQNISNADDRQIAVDLTPDYTGGLQNSMSYKNISLDFLFQFVKQRGRNYLSTAAMPGASANNPVEVLDRWRNPGENKPVQQYSSGLNDVVYRAYKFMTSSDAAYSDASFVRLKNVSLSYLIPAKWLNKGSCRIQLVAQNLLTLTSYKGFDPENQSFITLPPLRTITAGVQLNF